MRRLNTLTLEHAIENLVEDNIRSIQNFSINRMDLMIPPLSLIEYVSYSSMDLVVSPHNEDDITRLMGAGSSHVGRSCIRLLEIQTKCYNVLKS